MKKIRTLFLLSVIAALLACVCISCELEGPDIVIAPPPPPPGSVYYRDWDAAAIAEWEPMTTPGADAKGTASLSGENALITGAASDTWGGVQSPEFDLEISRNPFCYIETGTAAPKWGARFVPSTIAAGDNGWGFVLLGDDDDNTAGSHPYEDMGKVNIPGANGSKSYSTLYPGPIVKGRLWIYAAGRSNATVEIKSIKIYYPDEE